MRACPRCESLNEDSYKHCYVCDFDMGSYVPKKLENKNVKISNKHDEESSIEFSELKSVVLDSIDKYEPEHHREDIDDDLAEYYTYKEHRAARSKFIRVLCIVGALLFFLVGSGLVLKLFDFI